MSNEQNSTSDDGNHPEITHLAEESEDRNGDRRSEESIDGEQRSETDYESRQERMMVRTFSVLNPGDIGVTAEMTLLRSGVAEPPGLYTIQDGDQLSTTSKAGNHVWFSDRDGRSFNLAPSSEVHFSVSPVFADEFDIELVNGTLTVASTSVGPTGLSSLMIFLFHIKAGGVRLGATGTVFSVSRNASASTNLVAVLQGEVTAHFHDVKPSFTDVPIPMLKKLSWADSLPAQPSTADI